MNGERKCKATVQVEWRGADVILSVSTGDLRTTLDITEQALDRLRRRGAKPTQRRILAVGWQTADQDDQPRE